MADDRTFTLIGNFTDNITPALEGINRSLNQVKRTFESFGAKRGGTDTLTQSIGKVISAHVNLKREVKELREEMQKSFSTISEYNRLVGKAVGANKILQQSTAKSFGKQAADIANANDQLRQHGNLSRRIKLNGYRSGGGGGGGGGGYGRPPRAPRVGGGYGGSPPNGPGPGGPRGGGGYGGGPVRRPREGGGGFGESVMAYELGQRVSTVVEEGIMSGFRMGVALFQTTFKYIGDSFRERIEDQMTDLQAAGGNLAIAERQKIPFVKNLTDSIRFTQKTNLVLDKLANDLPGSNQDYIEVGKRLSDTMVTLVDYNKKGAMEFAKQLQVGNEDVYKAQQIKGTGSSEDIKNTITTITGEITKKVVIGGFGGSVGAGGVRGPNSLGGVIEKLITNPDISLAKVSKYASTFDPKILNALKRAFPKLDEAGDDLLKRAKVVNEMLDEIANPSMIAASKRTVEGVLEAYRGTFFSPESGLLGWGRKLGEVNKGTAPMIDEMGRYIKRTVDKFGQEIYTVVDSAEKASKENLSIFEMIGDLLANYGAILKPIADNLYLIWDPLKQLGDVLQKARDLSVVVFQEFRNYALGMEEIAKEIKNKEIKDLFLQTRNFRASLLTLTNMFKNMGIFSEEDFWRLREVIIDPKKGMPDLGKVLNEIVTKFFDSDGAKQLGEFFGTLLGTIAVELSHITGFMAKRLGAGKLTEGFADAFNAAGGQEAVIQIFNDIFKMLGDALWWLAGKIDWKVYLTLGGLLVFPALLQGLLVGFFLRFSKKLERSFINLFKDSDKAVDKALKTDKAPKAPIPKNPPTITSNTPGVHQTSAENMRTGSPKNVSFRPMPAEARTHPLFPNVALPGTYLRAVPGVTQPGPHPMQVPKKLVNPVKPVGGGFKSKAASLAVDGLLAFNQGVEKTGNVVKKAATKVGKGNAAFAAVDFGLRVAQGENAGKAALGAGGSLAGGVVGGIVGQALLPFLPGVGAAVGSIIGSFLGDWLVTELPNIWNNLTTALAKPFDLGKALGHVIGDLLNWGDQVKIWFDSLPGKLTNWWQGVEQGFGEAIKKIGKFFSEPHSWQELVTGLQAGFDKILLDLSNWWKAATAGITAGINERRPTTPDPNAGRQAGYLTKNGVKGWMSSSGDWTPLDATSNAKGSDNPYRGNLGQAIGSEMRNKPPGSDLVIANSSETVIPAAGGNRLRGLLDAIHDSGESIVRSMQIGVNSLNQTILRTNEQNLKAINQNGVNTIAAIDKASARATKQNADLQAAIKSISAGGRGPGGGGGPLAGGSPAIASLAQQAGFTPAQANVMAQIVKAESGNDPTQFNGNASTGDESYGLAQINMLGKMGPERRALFGISSNQQLFDPLTNLKAAYKIYTMAGGGDIGWRQWSTFNPSMLGHVGYAAGPGNPAFFSSQSAAENWERSMAPSSANIRSFTANSSEGFGSTINGGINVTVHAGNTSDHRQLAILVAREIGNAIGDVQASGLFP